MGKGSEGKDRRGRKEIEGRKGMGMGHKARGDGRRLGGRWRGNKGVKMGE